MSVSRHLAYKQSVKHLCYIQYNRTFDGPNLNLLNTFLTTIGTVLLVFHVPVAHAQTYM